MGRYHYWRLHPFTLDELPAGITRSEAFKRLMTVGGFPEPFLDGDERAASRKTPDSAVPAKVNMEFDAYRLIHKGYLI